LVREIASSGVDALIMQDLGAVDFIRNIAPNLPVHGRLDFTY
jgi:collagenase-like PrtC family protease